MFKVEDLENREVCYIPGDHLIVMTLTELQMKALIIKLHALEDPPPPERRITRSTAASVSAVWGMKMRRRDKKREKIMKKQESCSKRNNAEAWRQQHEWLLLRLRNYSIIFNLTFSASEEVCHIIEQLWLCAAIPMRQRLFAAFLMRQCLFVTIPMRQHLFATIRMQQHLFAAILR